MASRQAAPAADSSARVPAVSSVPNSGLRYWAFFAALYGVLSMGVDLKLIYHGGVEVLPIPSFFWGWDFARRLFGHPGGIGEYLIALAMQSMFHSWLGAAFLTGCGWLMWTASKACGRCLGLPWAADIALFFPTAMLALYARYNHACETLAAVLTVCAAAWFYCQLGFLKPRFRLAWFFAVAAVSYSLAPEALILLTITAAFLEWNHSRSGFSILGLFGISILAIWLLACVVFGYALDEAWNSLLPPAVDLLRVRLLRPGWLSWSLFYGFLPLLCVLAAAFKARSIEGRINLAASRWKTAGTWLANRWINTAVCVVALLAAFFTSHDGHLKARIAADYFASQNRWEEAYAAAENEASFPATASIAMQAAYHTGRLMSQMPLQKTQMDLFLSKMGARGSWSRSGLYLDLGYVNMAMHDLCEAVEGWGQRPILLRGLVAANLAIGNTNTAIIYLNALKRVPFHSGWATDYLRRFKADPSLAWDPEIVRLRTSMVRDDFVGELDDQTQLLLLLKANRRNRMAFEYLMAQHLMARKVDQFASELVLVEDFPGFKYPTMWEQALVICAKAFGPQSVPAGHPLDPQSLKTFEQMLDILRRHGGSKLEARGELEAGFGSTYFFYHIYGS